MTDLQELGGRIRELREARGLTKARAARLAGLSDGYWGNLEVAAENSRTKAPPRPSVPVVRAIADTLDVERAPLLELAGWPEYADADRARGGGHWVDVVRVVDPVAYDRIEQLAVAALDRAEAMGGHVATPVDPVEVARLTAAAQHMLRKARA